jgi:hypothetical protein
LLLRALDGEGEHPGRVAVSLDDETPARRLVLRLVDGQVGVWGRSGRAREEARWVEARAALASTPTATPGCDYLGARSVQHLASRVGGKFRNFIVYADTGGTWRMWTKADRRHVRAALLDVHPHDWTMAIGDGQKHAAIHAPVNMASATVRQVHLEGERVSYRVHDLLALVEAVEDLLRAGIHREQVESGHYTPRNTGEIQRVRECEPVIRPRRGGPAFRLALWLAERTP